MPSYRPALKWIFFALVGAVGVVSLMPQEALPETGVSDKLEHFAAYAVLGLVGFLAFFRNARQVLFSLMIYGATLEVLQGFVPGRQPSVADALANASGVVLAYCSIFLWKKIRTDD